MPKATITKKEFDKNIKYQNKRIASGKGMPKVRGKKAKLVDYKKRPKGW